MPWFDLPRRKARPWNGATVTDIYNEVRATREYYAGILAALAGITLTSTRTDVRLAALEATLPELRQLALNTLHLMGQSYMDAEHVRRAEQEVLRDL